MTPRPHWFRRSRYGHRRDALASRPWIHFNSVMPTCVRIALAAVLVAFLALGWNLTRPREPIVDGRPLTSWLDNIGQDAGEQQAARAVRTTGTNVIPTLLRMLRQRDPPFKRKLMELAQRQPFIKIKYVPAEMRNEQA